MLYLFYNSYYVKLITNYLEICDIVVEQIRILWYINNMDYLKRKIDDQLNIWKRRQNHAPLLISGANQTGKTSTILHFAKENYTNVIHICFGKEPHYKDIFANGYNTNNILKLISLRNPKQELKENETLIIFDEIEYFLDASKCFKSFREEGRFDIIAAGTLSKEEIDIITINSDNNVENIPIDTFNFEEYLWSKGYKTSQIELYFEHIINNFPLSPIENSVLKENFNEYLLTGGFPEAILAKLEGKEYSDLYEIHNRIYSQHKKSIESINKPKTANKIIKILDSIPLFLEEKYKKFQIAKAIEGARNREYDKCYDWLEKRLFICKSDSMSLPAYPIDDYTNNNSFKLYLNDTGLLFSRLNEDKRLEICEKNKLKTGNMVLYENFVANELKKQGYNLNYYRNEKGTIEVEFMISDSSSIVPIEVKSKRSASASLKNLINKNDYPDIRYGIKLSDSNIDFNGQYYTIPFALTFMIKRFINEMGY